MKRGQVTLFVLLGIALLLIVLLFLFLRHRNAEPVMENIPAEFQPVQEHVQDCLRLTTIDALKSLAMHGGYLDPLDPKETGRAYYLDPYQPTASELLRLNPADNESSIPYYYYLAGQNDCLLCLLNSLAPTKEHMEAMARKYVLKHLNECINFGIFSDISIDASPKEDLTIRFDDNQVIIDYERQLRMQKDESVQQVKTFYQKLDIPFLNYYETALEITKQEIQTQFLENYLLYILSAYSGLESQLPPIAAFDVGFSPKLWVLYSVKQRYQQLLYSLTPALQVAGTAGYVEPPTTGDPYTDGFLHMTRLNLFTNNSLGQDRFRVSILYPNLPIYLTVNPKAGQLIKPETQRTNGILMIPTRQLNYYNFYYDISAPFIVEIRHENAAPNTDFSFLFALEANIRENKNMVEWLLGRGTLPWDPSIVHSTITDPSDSLNTTNMNNALGVTGASAVLSSMNLSGLNASSEKYQHNKSIKSLLCSPPLQTVPVTARVFDARTDKALENVSFTFTCGEYDTCDVGFSKKDAFNVYALLDTKVAQCIGGTLKAEKEGYNSFSARISARNGQPVALPDISLDPFVTKRVRFVKRQLSKNSVTGALTLGSPQPLEPPDVIFATFQRKAGTPSDAPVGTTAFVGNGTNQSTIRLIPGLYEIRANYIDNDGYIIPAGCKRIHGHAIPEDPINITPAPWGGLEFVDGSTFLWQAERNDLYNSKELVVPIIVAPPPSCIDDLEDMGKTAEYTRRFKHDVTPYFD